MEYLVNILFEHDNGASRWAIRGNDRISFTNETKDGIHGNEKQLSDDSREFVLEAKE